MAKNVRLKWFGARVKAQTTKEMDKRLRRAAEFLKSDIQQSMRKGGGGAKAKKATGRVRRSRPGNPPFVQTGSLRQSIFVRKASSVEYQVGTGLNYGVMHELGIRYSRVGFQQRPFIRPALERNTDRIRKFLSA